MLVSISIGCTGYAVYADEVWYGMNFDYPPESDIRFSVSDLEDCRVFSMEFFDSDMMIWSGFPNDMFAEIQEPGISLSELRKWE